MSCIISKEEIRVIRLGVLGATVVGVTWVFSSTLARFMEAEGVVVDVVVDV